MLLDQLEPLALLEQPAVALQEQLGQAEARVRRVRPVRLAGLDFPALRVGQARQAGLVPADCQGLLVFRVRPDFPAQQEVLDLVVVLVYLAGLAPLDARARQEHRE